MKLQNLLFAMIIMAFSSTSIFAKGITLNGEPDDECKTYYDTAKKRIKEVFECKISYEVIFNPNTGKEEVIMKPTGIRHGLYIMYDVTGKQCISGYFTDNIKSGTWKYYDKKGKVVKTETYQGGKLVSK